LETFHTNEHRGNTLKAPVLALGNSQWLGDGFYFWQHYKFAEEWGFNRICKKKKYQDGILNKFDIYKADLQINFSNDAFLDTVFNETDYYKFLEKVEYFADIYFKRIRRKPTLEEFNDFIQDFGIWKNIKAIRFQDLPTNNETTYLKIKGFYYKKRIQIVVYDVTIIRSFVLHSTFDCKDK